MRLATLRTAEGPRAARVEQDRYVGLEATDVGALLALEDWQERAAADGPAYSLDTELDVVIPRPGKIVCVGLNYRSHILEMGRPLPAFPTLFAKFADTLIGPRDAIELPVESDDVDWEAELVVVIGATVRRAGEEQASAAIAGFTVMNDVSVRDWQFRTREWLQGKNFERTTPLGPLVVTPDELPGGVRPALRISAIVAGEKMQGADTSDLLFDPVDLVRYVSSMITLRPGDVIATGTPGGVGHARKPPRYLQDGEVVTVEVGGIGRLDNVAVRT
jgi:acylpyruvate hydrolase